MDRDTELTLVAGLRAGEEAAFDAVYDAYRARLFTFLVRLSRSRPHAEDLVAETWLRLVAHGSRLDPDTRLAPWLFTVARNLYFTACRARMSDDVACHSLVGLWPAGAPTPSPFETAALSERERQIEQALARLRTGDREVLMLVGVDDFTIAEAAAICGVTATTLRQRLSRARARLAVALADVRGAGLADARRVTT